MRAPSALLTAIALAGASPAVAAPCTAQNVVGVWSLVSIRAAEPGVEEFYAMAPNEWMRFQADGGYMYFASTRPMTDLARINAGMDRSDATDGTSYSIRWLGQGRMMILREGQPFQVLRCEILERAAPDAQAGDLILSQDDGMPMLRRVQRRVQ